MHRIAEAGHMKDSQTFAQIHILRPLFVRPSYKYAPQMRMGVRGRGFDAGAGKEGAGKEIGEIQTGSRQTESRQTGPRPDPERPDPDGPDPDRPVQRPVQTDQSRPVSYTHLRAHETKANLVCRLLLEKKNT